MLIIVEGADGAGKTTLIQAIVERLNVMMPNEQITTYHAGPPKLHPLDEYVTPLVSYRPGRGETIICDRWHWGEWVYPSLLHRPTQFDTAVSRYTEMFLHSRGAIVVFMDLSDQTIRKHLIERGDDLSDVRHTTRPATSFRSVYRHTTTLPTMRVHDRLSLSAVVPAIINFAGRRELDTVPLNTFATYVGVPHPRYLLFGERRNVIENHQPPGFMPYPTTSGHYLLSHYRPLSGDDRTFAIANACDVDDPRTLYASLLHQPIVVALGSATHIALTDHGIPHGVAPHPQFVRRFHHKSGHIYCRIINDALYGQLDMSNVWHLRG